MNASIRRIALALGLAFLALFVNLNYVQLARSTDLTEDARNRRNIIREYGTKRGEILGRGGTILARSVASESKQYKYRREYPLGDLVGHITGYYSFYFGSSGLERTYDEELLGREPRTASSIADDLLGREPAGNVLQTSLDVSLQRLAREKLDEQRGAAAVVDSSTGEVLALYANPNYDPNPLSLSPNRVDDIRDAWKRLTSDRRRLLNFRATQERYPPGSTFKIVTAAAALELAEMNQNKRYPFRRRLNLPDTDRTLGNFGGSSCGGSMRDAMRVSCNTYFAELGMAIGSDKLFEMAGRFGLNGPIGLDIGAARSCLRADAAGGCSEEKLSRPHTAYSSIGQFDVRVTPLQMALVAAAVGNGGHRLRPHLATQVLSPAGKVVQRIEPERTRIMSKKTASQLKSMMSNVVCAGTGRVVGFKNPCSGKIGGKTGTAQTGVPKQPPHVWFVAFGPRVAVAVVVENGGTLQSEATGGKVAGPIAKALLEKAIALRS